jgi:hypothetical protein
MPDRLGVFARPSAATELICFVQLQGGCPLPAPSRPPRKHLSVSLGSDISASDSLGAMKREENKAIQKLRPYPSTVMAALVAATQDHPSSKEIMGGRDKPGHDVLGLDKWRKLALLRA